MLNRRDFLTQSCGAVLLSLAPERSATALKPNAELQSNDASEGHPKAAVIFWKSGANPGETALLAGDGLADAKLLLARLPDDAPRQPSFDPHVSHLSTMHWEQATCLQRDNSFVSIEIPASWKPGQYAVRLDGALGDETSHILNRPELWWWLGDGDTTVSPRGELRVFGQFLAIENHRPQLWICDATHKWTALDVEQASPYSINAQLPSGLAAGKAAIRTHNGGGGDAGWSNELEIEIAPAVAWPARVFSVIDFGAKGDSIQDDTPAFQAALSAAASNHGGQVYVPRGVYRITAQLNIPARTVLRGESREAVWLMAPREVTGMRTLIGGMGQFAVEELSMVAQSADRMITAPDVESMYTAYSPYGEPGSASANYIRLSRLRIHHLRYAHRVGSADTDPRRLEEAGPSTIALAGSNLTIRDCVVVSPGMPFVLHRVRRSRVTGNEFRIGRNGWYGFWGASETLVEDNIFEGQDLEASYGSFANYGQNSGPEIARLFITGNRYSNSFGGEREALTFDSSGMYPWKGRLASGSANEVLLGSSGDGEFAGDDAWTGLGCLITSGRGLGQLRQIRSSRGNRLKLASAWDIVPDATSTIAVMPFKRDVVVYNNHAQDASVAVQLWGGGYNFIIDGNTTERSGGFWGSAAEYTDKQTTPAAQYFLPLYFTQWLRNEVRDGFSYQQGPDHRNGAVCGLYIRDLPQSADSGVLTFANILRGNRLIGRASLVMGYYDKTPTSEHLVETRRLRKKPWSMATVIEGNLVTDATIGVELCNGLDAVLVRRNDLIRVKEPVLQSNESN